MDTTQQELLRQAWLEGKHGGLPAQEQAEAWALREVWKDSGKGDHGMKTFIASKVAKQGGGHPSSEAMRKFFERIDADSNCFPGKANYENQGPVPFLTGSNRAAIARCAMTMKERDPTRVFRRGGEIAHKRVSQGGPRELHSASIRDAFRCIRRCFRCIQTFGHVCGLVFLYIFALRRSAQLPYYNIRRENLLPQGRFQRPAPAARASCF